MPRTTKDLKPESLNRERAFLYPQVDRTVTAKTQEEADKKLESILKEEAKSKDQKKEEVTVSK